MSAKKILLVEDEGMIALDLKRILENIGYEISSIVSRGEEAVKEAAKIRPDLVLMDITLKGKMNGIEAAKKIITLNIPVVYLTGASDNNTLKKATQMPVYGYIVKPYLEKELITTVEMALNKHQLDIARVEKFKQDIFNKNDTIKSKNINNPSSRLKPHILLVEDENITTMDIAGKLDELDYKVIGTVSSGYEAIEKARELNPDLILMDIILKGSLDGITVSKSIEELNIPVVYLTSYSDDKTLERAGETAPYGFIIKPYNQDELKTTIEMSLHKHQKNQEEIESEVGLITTKLWLKFLLYFSGLYGLTLAIFSFFKSSKLANIDSKLPNIKQFVSILVPAHKEVTRKDSKWDKTHHTGETIALDDKSKIHNNSHDL